MAVPKLRFKEFKGEWITKSLTEITEINPKNEVLPDKFIYIDLESVEKGILIKKKIIDKDKAPSRAQRTIMVGDILFQTVRPYQQNNIIIEKLESLPFVASTGYALIRTTQDSYFLYTLLHKDSFLDCVLNMCTGTSFPAISSNDLGTIKIKIPTISEQNKIEKVFKLLDKKIELQKKKIEALKLYKMCIMNELFSCDCFVEKNLCDLCVIEKGKQVNNEYLKESGKYYMLNGGITPSGYMNNYNTLPNTISISEGGNSCGFVNFNTQYFWSGGHCYTLKNVSINNNYLYHLLKYNQNSIMKLRVGTGLPNIQKKALECFKIKIHNNEKQKVISDILTTYDKKIKIEGKRLHQTILLKNSLLQMMFI